MCRRDERCKFLVRTEMRIDPCEIGDPVAVIARRLLARSTLHGFVFVDGTQPNRGCTERLDVVEALRETLQIATVIEALVARIKSGAQSVAAQTAEIVRRIAILEPIDEHEVDDLVFR
jgi:hypothetical protein